MAKFQKQPSSSSWFIGCKLVVALAYVLASLWANPCLSIEASISASASLLTTTNVLRQRPPLPSDSFDATSSLQQQEYTENDYYFRNTYNPYKLDDPYTLESRSNSNIPWGNINIVVLTAVHSWIAGGNHRDDPQHWPYDAHRSIHQNADYGDVLSFYQRLRELVDEHNSNSSNQKRDLFFVMNGDFVDGTGLSEYPPTHLAPLLSHMPWDAVNVGNHELYHDETIHYITNHHFEQDNYLSSNTRLTTTAANHRTSDDGQSDNNANIYPMAGQNYLYLQGHHTNTTILTFGFLYDFDENSPATKSKTVQEVIREEWFREVLNNQNKQHFDAVLVLAHMDCLDPLVRVLLEAIREALPPNRQSSMPIQFVTGHTHRRCHAKLDPNSESFEAGRFLDTIGFLSWDSMDLDEEENNTSDHNFQHRFWDVTKESLHTTLVQPQETSHGKSLTTTQKIYVYKEHDFDKDFGTHEGRALSQAIRNTQTLLGLDETLGCSPNTFGIFQHNPHQKHDMPSTSLFQLYLSQMLPTQLLAPIWKGDHNDEQEQHFEPNIGEPVFVAGSGSLRYTLFAGPVTVNDVIAIDPFNNSIFELVATAANNGSIAAAQEQQQQQFQPIYGHELQEWLEAANNLYAQVAEYGMPTFVLSTLPLSDLTSAAAATIVDNIDPTKVYRIFATDYDASRLLSVLDVLKESKRSHSFAHGDRAVYQSQPFCPESKDKGNDQAACVFLTELWKDYIRKHMPCEEQEEVQQHFSFGSYPISLSAQLFPESATTARIQSRRTAPHDAAAAAPLANDQKAALVVVLLAFAMILYMLVYPPQTTENDGGVSNNTQRNRHSFSCAEDSPASERFYCCNNDDNELLEGGTMDVQLIPLCRLDTGNLSNDSSYGSI